LRSRTSRAIRISDSSIRDESDGGINAKPGVSISLNVLFLPLLGCLWVRTTDCG